MRAILVMALILTTATVSAMPSASALYCGPVKVTADYIQACGNEVVDFG